MKCITLKRGVLASLYPWISCLAIALIAGTGTTLAQEGALPYQSTFDDYKTTNPDAQTDAKSPALPHDHSEPMQQSAPINHGDHQHADIPSSVTPPLNHQASGHTLPQGEAHVPESTQPERPELDHCKMKDHGGAPSHAHKPGHDHSTMHPAAESHHDPQETHHSEHTHPLPEGVSHAH